MRATSLPEETGFVSLDRGRPAGQSGYAGTGYRLAAGGLGRRWTPPGEDSEEPCLEDEFVAHTARAWTRLRGMAAGLPDAARIGLAVASGQVDRVNVALVCQATAVCALAAIGASTALYWQKSRTVRVDHEIGHVVGEMAQAEAQTGRLRAQWLALNDPARLQDAATRYSGLRPLAPAQFVDAGKLADHLPSPGAVPQDGGVEAAPEAAIAGDAGLAFKPVAAQAASTAPAPAQPDAPVAASPQAKASAVAPIQLAGTELAGTEPASAEPETAEAAPVQTVPAPHATGADWADARQAQADDTIRDAPKAATPHPHAFSASRLAMAAPHVVLPALRAASPTVVHATSAPVRVAPPATHAEPKPHAQPRMLMARFDMPRWLMESHSSHPAMIVMSAPPHALGVPHDTSVLEPGARHPGEPALVVKSEARAVQPAATEPQADDEPAPHPVYRRPVSRPYYGYGYGYGGQYGYPYQQPRAYPNPYGYQPYGGGAYYQ